MAQELLGVIPPLVTPFDAEDRVDETALRQELRYMLAAGVHGVAVCGSTGEGHTLSAEEVRRITAIAVEEVQGRLPVITGIIADSTAQAIRYAEAVRDLGVAALQVTPVHYLFRPTEAEMYAYYAALARAAGLPILVYNVVPWAYVAPELLVKMVREIDEVIGVKQSAGDMHALATLLTAMAGHGKVFAAVDDLLYPCFVLGADGAIAAIVTAAPQLCVALWQAVQQGDHRRARQLHEQLLILWQALAGPCLPATVKLALQLQGRAAGRPRRPFAMPEASVEARLRAALHHTGLLAAAATVG
ncbi:MAG: dihydrodipicolinate synthase family protein [Candidatus Tectimicrobiota bacterium]|nr:MAG: dihydrodipicolinate synthase family protein [Candidatus Tectomicrobia bacterium]